MIRWLALALLAVASPALATVDTWPALYDVAFVDADDALNIRSGPGTDHGVIGTLSHDATGVEVTAVNDDETWGRVNIGEGSGWVSMDFMDRLPNQYENFPPALTQCFGTEPFWSITAKDGALEFSSQDGAGWSERLAGTASSRNLLNRHAFLGETATLIVMHASCSDGMSDRHYGLSADLVFSGGGDAQMLSGCCTLSEQ